RPEDAMPFAEEPSQVAQVLEDEPAHDEIELPVRERQRLVQIVNDELDCRRARFATGRRQHLLGEVDRGHHCAGGSERDGMTASTAPEVEHAAATNISDRIPHDGLLQRGKRVRVVIVDERPAVVPGPDGVSVRPNGHPGVYWLMYQPPLGLR